MYSPNPLAIGIPTDKLEEIFVPFHELDPSLSREFEGSGLGLTLVRRLALLHHGEVSVESALDRGSTFHLDFPLPAEIQSRMPVEPIPVGSTRSAFPSPVGACSVPPNAVSVWP